MERQKTFGGRGRDGRSKDEKTQLSEKGKKFQWFSLGLKNLIGERRPQGVKGAHKFQVPSGAKQKKGG